IPARTPARRSRRALVLVAPGSQMTEWVVMAPGLWLPVGEEHRRLLLYDERPGSRTHPTPYNRTEQLPAFSCLVHFPQFVIASCSEILYPPHNSFRPALRVAQKPLFSPPWGPPHEFFLAFSPSSVGGFPPRREVATGDIPPAASATRRSLCARRDRD